MAGLEFTIHDSIIVSPAMLVMLVLDTVTRGVSENIFHGIYDMSCGFLKYFLQNKCTNFFS